MARVGSSGEQNERMMRAAASGNEVRARAAAELAAQRTQGAQQGIAAGMQYGQMAAQGEQFQQRMAHEESALDLQAAQSGFERGGPQGDDRMARLQEEMARGEQQRPQGMIGPMPPEAQSRLQEQTGQGHELDGSRSQWRPTTERQASQRFEREKKAYAAQTERIRAEAYREQVASQYRKAQIEKNEEEMKAHRSNLIQPVKSNVARFERFMNGKNSDADWASMEQMAEGFDQQGDLQSDIKARQWTPRVQKFMQATISKDALKFISQTGDLPDGDLVDLSSPVMQQFSQAAGQVAGYMTSLGPEFSQWMGIDSMAGKTRFLNQFAAGMVLSGMMQQAAADPFGGAVPSTGGPEQAGAGAPPQSAGLAEQARGTNLPSSTPAAGRRAGEFRGLMLQAGVGGEEMIPPTDSPGFRRMFGR